MRIMQQADDGFVADRFPNIVELSKTGHRTVWSAGVERPLLVVRDEARHVVVVYEYDSKHERLRDAPRVLRQDDDDEPDAGAPVPRRPLPPQLAGACEHPWPDSAGGDPLDC